MFGRRTFIVRVYAHPGRPIVEDVATRERVRLPDLTAIAAEIERRLDHPTRDPSLAAAPERDERP